MTARRRVSAPVFLSVLSALALSACAASPTPPTPSGADGAPTTSATPEPALEIAVVADPAHGWISVSGTVSGAVGEGTCTVTVSLEGEPDRVRTSAALPGGEGTKCGHLSVEVATTGHYEISLEVTEVTPTPLTASTSVDYEARG